MSSASKRKPPSSRDKVRSHRTRLRAQGLRPIQIWVPDTRSAKFAAEAHRQSRLVAESPHAAEDQAFIDAISEFNDG
jgi:Antitoxin MazE-like